MPVLMIELCYDAVRRVGVKIPTRFTDMVIFRLSRLLSLRREYVTL